MTSQTETEANNIILHRNFKANLLCISKSNWPQRYDPKFEDKYFCWWVYELLYCYLILGERFKRAT